MKATEFLSRDHRRLESLFAEYGRLGGRASGRKRELFEEIRRELEAHVHLLEQIFYPAVGRVRPRGEVGSGPAGTRALKDHVAELRALEGEADARRFDERLGRLRREVRRHAEREEGHLFPAAEALLPGARLDALGAELARMKEGLSSGRRGRLRRRPA